MHYSLWGKKLPNILSSYSKAGRSSSLTVLTQTRGGEEVLLDVGGQDATEAFEDVGHSDEAREILQGLLAGTLKRTVCFYTGPVPLTCCQIVSDVLLHRRATQFQRPQLLPLNQWFRINLPAWALVSMLSFF
jgi:Cytochrome b5-like Heme/Steroid binding domain